MRAYVKVMVRAPDLGACPAGQSGVDGTAGRGESPTRAANEPATLVGYVELERLDEVAELTLPAHELVLEDASDVREGMHHQPPADEPRRVGEAVRVARVGGQAEKPDGADGVCRQHHHL